jgi:2-methylcitrate dehydratase PrpD
VVKPARKGEVRHPVTKQHDIIDALVSFTRRARFERISDRVLALAKIHIIDGVGVMLAGAASPAARVLHRRLFAVDCGSGSDAVGTERALDPPFAAFANAFSARVQDYDDVQTTDISTYGLLTHPTAPVLAAVLAVGQARSVSGAALLTAYLAGVEVSARLAASVDSKLLRSGLAPTAAFGGIGALLAAAKLLELRPKAVRSALSIWESTTALDGYAAEVTLNAALRDAQSARMAVEAALLAAEGMTVDVPVLRSLSVIGTLPVPTMAKSRAKPYYIQNPGFAIRVYPSHPLSHPALDLMLAIVNLHGIRATEIKRVEVGVTRVMAEMLSLTPPATIAEVRRSLPFAIALAACKGVVVPNDFDRLPRRKALQDFMPRVHSYVDPELDALGHELAWTIIRVTLDTGRVIQMKANVAKGTPLKPLSQIELFHKFFQCALCSLDEQRAEQLLSRLWSLDELPDVANLFKADASCSDHADHPADHHHEPGHRHEHGHEPRRKRSRRR